MVFELAGADLGALQVGEDADGLALFAGDGADHLDELGLLGVGAVGEVEAGDVEAGADELAEELGRAAGGAEGGDDLGAAGSVPTAAKGDRRTGDGLLRGSMWWSCSYVESRILSSLLSRVCEWY